MSHDYISLITSHHITSHRDECTQGAEYPGTSGFVYIIEAVEKRIVGLKAGVSSGLEMDELSTLEQVLNFLLLVLYSSTFRMLSKSYAFIFQLYKYYIIIDTDVLAIWCCMM